MGKIKGIAWIGTLDYLSRIDGEAGLEKVKSALNEHDRQALFGKSILPLSWVEYATYVRSLLTADRVLGTGDKELIRQAVRHEAERALQGLCQALISFVNPQVIIDNAAKLWQRYFDEGTVKAYRFGRKRGTLEVKGFSNMPAEHEIFLSAFTIRCLEMCGVKHITSRHNVCLARSDDRCVFDFSWE